MSCTMQQALLKWGGNVVRMRIITAGGRYTVEESEQSPIYQYELKFNYSEGDSGSYWYYIVIGGDTTFDFQRLGNWGAQI